MFELFFYIFLKSIRFLWCTLYYIVVHAAACTTFSEGERTAIVVFGNVEPHREYAQININCHKRAGAACMYALAIVYNIIIVVLPERRSLLSSTPRFASLRYCRPFRRGSHDNHVVRARVYMSVHTRGQGRRQNCFRARKLIAFWKTVFYFILNEHNSVL